MRKFLSVVLGMLLAVSMLFSVQPLSSAANYQSSVSWNRTDIGTGWASAQYRQIFNAGDLDGNGFQDMMLIDRSGKLWLYPAKSDTEFSARRQVGSGWNNMRQIFGGIDFNGDSAVDILGIDWAGTLITIEALELAFSVLSSNLVPVG